MICIVVVSHRAVADGDVFEHKNYDRRFSEKVVSGLERMDFDFRHAKRLITFDSDQILFEDHKGDIKEYQSIIRGAPSDRSLSGDVRNARFKTITTLDHFHISPSLSKKRPLVEGAFFQILINRFDFFHE